MCTGARTYTINRARGKGFILVGAAFAGDDPGAAQSPPPPMLICLRDESIENADLIV